MDKITINSTWRDTVRDRNMTVDTVEFRKNWKGNWEAFVTVTFDSGSQVTLFQDVITDMIDAETLILIK